MQRVRVRGTAETGTVLSVESRRDFDFKMVLFVTVQLDYGPVMVYEISELTSKGLQPNLTKHVKV